MYRIQIYVHKSSDVYEYKYSKTCMCFNVRHYIQYLCAYSTSCNQFGYSIEQYNLFQCVLALKYINSQLFYWLNLKVEEKNTTYLVLVSLWDLVSINVMVRCSFSSEGVSYISASNTLAIT